MMYSIRGGFMEKEIYIVSSLPLSAYIHVYITLDSLHSLFHFVVKPLRPVWKEL